MLGDPAEAQSHAAARSLGQLGESALPAIERLGKSDDADPRCGALRALGYMYWMGPIQRNYYTLEPQKVTPAIARAVDIIAPAASDPAPDVRHSVVEAMSLIGSENERIFAVIRKLAVDDDARVRTAALRMSKYRFNKYDHCIAMAYALLAEKPFGDRTSADLAGNLINHQRINGPIDLKVVGRHLGRIGPGQGGGVVSGLGDTMRRIKADDGTEALNDPQVLQGVLNVYAIGYRNYMLYGVERWITYRKNIPAFRAKVDELTAEIKRLQKDKPDKWQDLSARYGDAVEGLKALIDRAEKLKPKKKAG
ncbi:MAG: HEAT repeat domain-containing protein [Phycisphaerae bacterium]|nr:HEAT repeat domain-containing protein [Phycisphaerae bacterium]